MQQIEELQGKYNDQVQQCCALTNKLNATQVRYLLVEDLKLCFNLFIFLSLMCKCLQKDLDLTTKLLANTEDELRLSKYSLKERDFIISEQKKAGIS